MVKGTMKRVLGLLSILLICAAGFLYIWGFLPFVPATDSDIVSEIRSARLPIIIFVVIAIVLLAIFLYSGDIIIGLRRRYRAFISPVIEENHRVSLVLSNRFEGTEKALESFASAMQEYAHHIASHTSAIQGLSEASQALKNSAAEQNQILYRLSHTLGTEKSVGEVSRVERVVSELEKRTQLVLQVKDELEAKRPATELTSPREIPSEVRVQSPPGCLANPRALYKKWHFLAKSAA